jgi:hypothetical protein
VGLAVAVALLGVLVVGLLRAHAEVLRALHQLGVDLDPSTNAAAGQSTPVAPPGIRPTPARPPETDVIDLTGETPSGDAIGLAVAGVRHDTLVAFLTSGCATCRAFWDAFRDGLADVPGGARLVVVTRGSEAESPGAIAGLAGHMPVVMSTEVWDHYDVPYAPYFVYVSGPAGRVVGEGVASTWPDVRKLVANAVADGTTRPVDEGTAGVFAAGTDSIDATDGMAGTPGTAGTAANAASRSPAAPPPSGASRPRSRADRERDDAVDRQLRAAGIEPGDPRLYPTSIQGGSPNP